MKKFSSLFLLVVLYNTQLKAQSGITDTIRILDSVKIKAFDQNRGPLYAGIQVSYLNIEKNKVYNKSSLLSGLNSIPGVRMEERSPGSYRISFRGSSLRSPFGVRNIKVYWNDLPVTDPGGTTYFNQFAWNNVGAVEVFKGPASSMYGAGTGGLILLNQSDNEKPGLTLDFSGGSFGLMNLMATGVTGNEKGQTIVTAAHQQSDGYRDHTRFRRDNMTISSHFKNSEKGESTLSLLYTDMSYMTPGGLTLTEYNANPRASRPAAGGFPSAKTAKADIYQQTLLGGFTHTQHFSDRFSNNSLVYGNFASVKNPTFRNYERRLEPSFGARTVFRYALPSSGSNSTFNWGAELQDGYFNSQVSKNKNGNQDTLQTNDDIQTLTYNVFAQATLQIRNNWVLMGGASMTRTVVNFTRLSTYPVVHQSKDFKNELSPRLSLVHNWNKKIYWLASVSRGFSPPTTAELLPSTGVISTNLEAEAGWNYESTIRLFLFRNALHTEVTAYTYKLQDALVPRRDVAGADYFVNAGDVEQKGIEWHTDYSVKPHGRFLDLFTIKTDLAFQHYRYGSFNKTGTDFSGKKVPSVPAVTGSAEAGITCKNGLYLNLSYYSASRIYLNDANTAFTDSYTLLGFQAGWKKTCCRKITLGFYAGADNLLDEKYSLGNDINATGSRYYNLAPGRNYYAGVSFQRTK